MRIKEGNKWKLAFKTQYGYFDYQVMSFGLSNTSASSWGYINKKLAKKLNIHVIVYLDNIFIYTIDLRQAHFNAISCVLDILSKNSLYANPKKYMFHKDEVHFLDYVILAQSLKKDDKKIKVVKDQPNPKSV